MFDHINTQQSVRGVPTTPVQSTAVPNFGIEAIQLA
jgi:hypothetical protein